MLPTALLADPTFQPARVRCRRAGVRRVALPRPRLPRARLVALALAVLAVGAMGFLRAWPPLATVMSASMEPTIKTGDMVVLKRLDGPARAGDVVVISVPDEARTRYGYPPVVIHRVVAVGPDGQVTTKGDAKQEPDPFTVPHAALTTKVVATLPAAGRVFAFLTSGLGLLWLGAGGVMLLVMPMLDRQKDARRRAEAEAEDLHETLRGITSELESLRGERVADVLDELPGRIEQAVATAVAALAAPVVVDPAPVVVRPALASAPRPERGPTPDPFARPAAPARAPTPSFALAAPATPDLLDVLRPRLVAASSVKRTPAPPRWDTPPPAASGRFARRAPTWDAAVAG